MFQISNAVFFIEGFARMQTAWDIRIKDLLFYLDSRFYLKMEKKKLFKLVLFALKLVVIGRVSSTKCASC